ncbi:MAG: PorT family protein [Bacteroidetes bacterium]|nr:PorT family protein [Bacteroidota bacterium]
MKHWRNNWEKFVSKKLQDAETSPEPHVWELIEQQLNAQDANATGNTYKVAAALALVLLMATASLFMINSPQGELAQFNSHLDLNSITAPVAMASETDESIEISIMNKITSDLERNRLDKTITADLNPLGWITFEDNSIRHDGTIKVPNFNTILNPQHFDENVHLPYVAANVNGEKQYVFDASTVQLSYYKLNNWRADIMPNNTRSLANITNHQMLPNDILISQSIEPSLAVMQDMMHIQTVNKSFINHNSINAELAYHHEVLAKEFNSTAMVNDNELMLVVAEQQTSWLAEAQQELEEWKASIATTQVETQLKEQMDEKIQSQLIEEAILDEDDPLTKLQKKQKDLYYANNINKGFHIGLVTGFQNTWVAKASRNKEVSRDDVQYKFSPGYQVGLNFGYDFTNHFGLMAEVKYSDEGTRYYNPAKDRTEHLNLKYIEVPLYVKFKHSKPTSKMKPMVFNYLAGVSFSDLRSVSTTINGEIDQRFAQDYNTSEWGLTAGFDFDIYMNRNLFWTVGTRVGISGLSKSFPKFKGEETGTLNYSVGIFTRISFRKPGK